MVVVNNIHFYTNWDLCNYKTNKISKCGVSCFAKKIKMCKITVCVSFDWYYLLVCMFTYRLYTSIHSRTENFAKR